jgi:hypothetical protein
VKFSAMSSHDASTVHEVGDRDVRLHVVLHAIESTLAETGKVERGFAQRLGRNGARVDRGATGFGGALHDAHALAEIRGLRGALLAGRAGANDEQVVVIGHVG